MTSELARDVVPGLRPPGRKRRGVTVTVIGLVAVLAAGAGYLVAAHRQVHGAAASAPPPLPTVAVSYGDLTATVRVNGSLGYAGALTVVGEQSGVVTGLPATGQVIPRGQDVYQVGQQPIPLLYGMIPFYRPLAVGSAGADVRELNDNLAALGYADAGSLAPAGTYTLATAAAVARWQAVLGLPATGLFSAGDAVVAPGAIRVTSVTPVTGQLVAPGQIVLTATQTSRRVLVNLDVTEQTYAHRGEHVQVELPADGTAAGTITSVGTVATSATAGDSNGTAGQAGGSSAGTQTIPVSIALGAGPAALGGLDQAPVTVDLIEQTRHDVLSVPIDALQAEPDGISAVTVIDSRSHPHLVPVRTGLFTSGRVEISGSGITAGTRVEVASL